jgi:hypothetical protein
LFPNTPRTVVPKRRTFTKGLELPWGLGRRSRCRLAVRGSLGSGGRGGLGLNNRQVCTVQAAAPSNCYGFEAAKNQARDTQ